MAEVTYIRPLTTGRYWFTSPQYPEPQVLWYCALTNTIMILGRNNPRPLDASVKIIGPCQFITVRVTQKGDERDSFVGVSPNEPPVMRQKSPMEFYEIDIDVDKDKIRFIGAKTYEKRHDLEESTEFEIALAASGSVTIYQLGRSRMTKRTPQNDVGEFGSGERGGPGQLSCHDWPGSLNSP